MSDQSMAQAPNDCNSARTKVDLKVNTAVHNDVEHGGPRIGPLPSTPDKVQNAPHLLTAKRKSWMKRSASSTCMSAVAKRVKVDMSITMSDNGTANAKDIEAEVEKPFPFLKLPAELRNQIYVWAALMSDKQTLLSWRPRVRTLRSSTQRTRFIDAGKYKERDYDIETDGDDDSEDEDNTNAPDNAPAKATGGSQEVISRRPFVSLTQVCQQIRKEFLMTYISNQEVGIDLMETAQYMAAFYNPGMLRIIEPVPEQVLPFQGNLTIAVPLTDLTPLEKGEKPKCLVTDILPLLDVWANAAYIEAGFGRYADPAYSPDQDGEAKDLYRLFGRRVLPDRSCGPMNKDWRGILRGRCLAGVRVDRNPNKPTFDIIMKKVHAMPWMRPIGKANRNLPRHAEEPRWLSRMGFDHMEHFRAEVHCENFVSELSSKGVFGSGV